MTDAVSYKARPQRYLALIDNGHRGLDELLILQAPGVRNRWLSAVHKLDQVQA